MYLVGGEMRALTKAFFGEITNKALQDMHFHRAFLVPMQLKEMKL